MNPFGLGPMIIEIAAGVLLAVVALKVVGKVADWFNGY